MTPVAGPAILLVSPDLMLTSQVAGLAAQVGGQLETLSRCAATATDRRFDLVLVDLGSLRESPDELLRQLQSSLANPPAAIVAFGPHVHKQRLEAAVRAGCTEAISRGELIGSFAACVSRWCGGSEPSLSS